MKGRKSKHLRVLGGVGMGAAAGLALALSALWFASREPPSPTDDADEGQPPKVGLSVGDLAPDFTLPALDGGTVKLSDFRGQAVLVNFWASWCAPCRAEMPDLNDIYGSSRDKLVVLGINLLEDRETIRAFLDEIPIRYPILLDQGGEVSRLYRLYTQPVTYFLDARGVIVDRKFGPFTPEELRTRVEKLLASRAQPSSLEAQPAVNTALKTDVSTKVRYFSESELNNFLRERPEAADVDLTAVPYVAELDLEQLRMGCPFVDCIPSIDGPAFESPREAEGWLKTDDLVLGVEFQDVAKAYPVKILNWHEIVNDEFAGAPVAVTYCPLCYSGVAFLRTIELEGQPRVLEFGVSGRLYKSDLVMYDRQTGTLWSQIEGRAIVGPLAGYELKRLPLEVLPWSEWRRAHPDTLVLARPTVNTPVGGRPPLAERRKRVKAQSQSKFKPLGDAATAGEEEFLRNYEQTPYVGYHTNDYDTFGTPWRDKRLRAKAVVWGLVLNGQAKAYEAQALRKAGRLNDEVGGMPVLLVWTRGTLKAFERRVSGQVLTFERRGDSPVDRETGSRWTPEGRAVEGPLKGAQLAPIVAIQSYWFAWAAFHPDTRLFSGTSD